MFGGSPNGLKEGRQLSPLADERHDDSPDRPILSVKGVARLLMCHPNAVYGLAETEGLPGRKVGRSWRFNRDEVLRWVGGTGGSTAD